MNAKEKAKLEEWLEDQYRCAVCHWPENDMRRRLEVHHIVGGPSRSKAHNPKCYLRLCNRCHQVFHSGKIVAFTPDLNMGTLLQAKLESDPDNYDPKFLAELKHKQHLGHDPEEIPEYYIEERERNKKWSQRNP